ncbi:uncharacterized protein LOC125588571 [Brassica napus]|uniref:uncharacterized protein LOC125588571 n=1 Tax=Brassica napus TaxID=3708 RepID=UPI0020798E01|nr:uncharacterized protein LOC125588571 [Brassica napus]
MVDLLVQFGDLAFYLTCVYGEPATDGRSGVWERLRRLGLGRSQPWCMVGDFNEILSNEEKTGGPMRPEESFKYFADMLSARNMEELVSKGDRFTWGGMRWKKWIQCCLDRCFGNKAWRDTFPGSNQSFLEKRGSDHRPVWVNLCANPEMQRGQFKFDKRILHYPDAMSAVKGAWSSVRANASVAVKIRKCRGILSAWRRKKSFNAKDKINKLQIRLEWFQSKSYPCWFVINTIKKELMQAYKEEEMFWRQKSREKWLRLGDRNSKFFHLSVKANRARLYLLKLKDKRGQDQWSDAAKAEVAVEYFSELFTSSNPPSYEAVFQSMIPKVTPGMNRCLTAKVTKEEVREAIFSIKADSAPGPDGMTGHFFQKFWPTIGEEVTKEIQEVFVKGTLPDDWNFTYLCLLPKIANPENMTDLRPISLCSVLYKAISRILVKRLQPFLSQIVSVNQSAFISERLIQDNVLIAHEAVHALKTHRVIAAESVAIKTDMSKAYDRVEWKYLEDLLKALGFAEQWVVWIMMCVSSVSFAVLMNDQPFGLISPSRGIRQGDPLSPFLFVLCTEGLSHLLNVAERNGFLKGMSFDVSGPSVHHIFFADDSLFLCQASAYQCRNLKKILCFYGEASGQCINYQKSAMTFGHLVSVEVKSELQNIMGIYNEGGMSKYLGLPEDFSGSKINALSYLKDKTQGRLETWFLRKLSQGGKEILLKTSASALPVFPMSCFRLPKTVIKRLASMMANFWWNSHSHMKKIHWVAWDKMCLPKELGGMGFKDLEIFNQALLAKQGWRLINQPESLLARFIKSRYYPHSDFLHAPVGYRPSFAWRSILFGRELLQKGLKWQIGNGRTTRVWLDKWVHDPEVGMRAPWIKNNTFDVNLKVSAMIDGATRRWNLQALEEIFVPGDVQLIAASQPIVSREDSFTWKFNRNGLMSVHSAYGLAREETIKECHSEALALPSLNPIKERIWKIPTVPKIRIFLWKVLSEAIPVADLILKRGMKVDERCQLCGLEGETIQHVLFQCAVARQVWALSGIPQPMFEMQEGHLFSNINYLMNLKAQSWGSMEEKRAWPWVLWFLWKSRNDFIFNGARWMPMEIVVKAKNEADGWFLAQEVDKEVELEVTRNDVRPKKRWLPPEESWLMCNVAFEWNKDTHSLGGAWVVRNHRGVALTHSRRAFSQVGSLDDARLKTLLWALESMMSMRYDRMVFAGDFKELFLAFQNPHKWPALRFQVEEMRILLSRMKEFQLKKVSIEENRGASLIAQSITRQNRSQSYVAIGHPSWLGELFVNECRSL